MNQSLNDLFSQLLTIYLHNWQLLTADDYYKNATNCYYNDIEQENDLPLLKYDIKKLLPNFTNIPNQVIQDLYINLEQITFKESQTTGVLSFLLSAYKIFWLAIPNVFIKEKPVNIEIGDMDVSTIILPANPPQTKYIYTIKSLKLTTSKIIIPNSLKCFFKIDNTNMPFSLYQYIPTQNITDDTIFFVPLNDIEYSSIDRPLTTQDLLDKLNTDYSINKDNFLLHYATTQSFYNN